MLKKILLISFLFIPVGILTGYFVDRFQTNRLQKQHEKMLIQIKESMENMEDLEDKLDSLQGKEILADTLNGNSVE